MDDAASARGLVTGVSEMAAFYAAALDNPMASDAAWRDGA